MRNSMRRSCGTPALRPRHAVLDLDGAGDGVHHAGEFGEHAVAGQLDDAALVLGDLGVDQLLAAGLECGERRRLVDAHEPGVADHVGGQYGGEPSVGVFVSHWHRLFPRDTASPQVLLTVRPAKSTAPSAPATTARSGRLVEFLPAKCW